MPLIVCLNSEEKGAVKELEKRMRNELTPRLKDDSTLFYRFLKARDFDVDKAEKMLRKHIQFRKFYQVETILEDFKPKEFFLKYLNLKLIGHDKEGDVVRYCPVGRMNSGDIFKCMKHSDHWKHWAWSAEVNVALHQEMSQNTMMTPLLTLILDMDKLEFSNATSKTSVEMFVGFTNMYQDNYPEGMKSIYVINAPHYCSIVLWVIKQLMSSAMIQKIYVFGNDGWKEKLLETIDADILPKFLGGNRSDPDDNDDPLCETSICLTDKISEAYYLTDEQRYLSDSAEVEQIIVPPSKKKEILMDVKVAGSVIQWRFQVKGKDIGFGLFLLKSTQDVREIIPIQKYNTSDGSEDNLYRCRSAGKYMLVFDNSQSWLNSKEIRYCISLQEC